MRSRRDSLRGATPGRPLARAALALHVAGFCFIACGCKENICKVTVEAYVRQRVECDGDWEGGPVPDEVDCPEVLAEHLECTLPCYYLPCDTPAEAFNACVSSCP